MALRIHTEVNGPFAQNTHFAVDTATGQGIVVDPGIGIAGAWERYAAQEGATLAAIFLTHAHLDHIFGLKELKEQTGAPIYLHEGDLFLIDDYVSFSARWGFQVEPAPRPDEFWQHGDMITIGETQFQVIHTPGHSPGSCCIRADDALFTGDTLMGYSVGRTDLPGGDTEALVASIRERLYSLPESVTLYPGHMAPTTIGDEKQHNGFIRG